MITPPLSPAEQVSALVDGQLQCAELAQVLKACEDDASLLASWRDYHLIGDALRGEDALSEAAGLSFLARLQPALQAESVRRVESVPGQSVKTQGHVEAANEPRFRWRWAGAAASVMALAAVAWSLGHEWLRDESALAGADAPTLWSTPQGVMVRDAALEDLMEAHRQQGAETVLPMPSGFLRNATFESPTSAEDRSGVSRP